MMFRMTLLGAGGGSGVGGATDPYFANVVFLWEAEGANGAGTPFTANSGQTITGSGTAALSNTQARIGTTSFFVGTGGATVPWSTDWNIGGTNTTPWTIEFSAYQTARNTWEILTCLLYTSDAADERSSVDL